MAQRPGKEISIVLPAKNEAASIGDVLARLREVLPQAEIIVVDDGSTDDTGSIAAETADQVVRHPQSMGNGAAVKAGVRCVARPLLILMDADGQHRPEDIPLLLEQMEHHQADMIVGSRSRAGQASAGRALANRVYSGVASMICGRKIDDLTSGFRIARRDLFVQFLELLPNGFSYPTTITMAFLRSGFSVVYCPVEVLSRVGKSHISPLKDGVRFLIIIFKVATLYAPMKLFAPLSALFLGLGLTRYLITFIENGRFTNMSALLLSVSIIVFLIGLVSEQITTLVYLSLKRDQSQPDER